MNLSGQQRKKLRDALISAFPEKSLLEQLLAFELDKKLNLIAQDNNLQTIVYKLIETSQAEEWLVELVRAARKENPGNSELKAIAQELLPMMDKSSEMESDCSSNSTSVAISPVTKATGKAIFVLSGTINAVDKEKLKAIEEHLRTILGDATLTITDIKSGSIKITLEGSLESLERLKELVESGQLNEVLGLTIEEVQLVTSETLHNKNAQSSQDSNPNLRHNPIGIKWFFTNLIQGNLISAFLILRNLWRNDLRGANLERANLRGAYLERANLERANLRDANLERANLNGAYLEEANLERANLDGAYLEEANLERAYLRRAYLEEANLERANLERANLERANLRGANLERANLERANLRGANLRGVNLERAIVTNAFFGETTGLTEDIKQDLEQRGAIFSDYPGVRSEIFSPAPTPKE